jgi:hypothetical protein
MYLTVKLFRLGTMILILKYQYQVPSLKIMLQAYMHDIDFNIIFIRSCFRLDRSEDHVSDLAYDIDIFMILILKIMLQTWHMILIF